MKLSAFVAIFISVCSTLLLHSCREEIQTSERKANIDSFVRDYNAYIKSWLSEEQTNYTQQLTELEKKISEQDSESEKEKLQSNLEGLKKNLERVEFRQSLGDYFSMKTIDDLPKDLVWENGMENPEIGDSRATKGGIFQNFITEFPKTLRPIGDSSNHSSRRYMYDEINMYMVNKHPITDKIYPGLAHEWAEDKNGKTVYFRIDPKATFSDGESVQAEDVLCYFYIRLSDNISAPFQKQYFKDEYAQLTIYDERTIAVTLPVSKVDMPSFTSVGVSALHFYQEYGPDYKERYQWKFPPTTGAYQLLEKDIKKGRSFTMSRVKDWWAKDRKFYRYTNNVDKILYQVIAEGSKAFEMFKLGKIDTFGLGLPEYWYDKMEIPEYFNGYLSKAQFYNVYPRVPRGFYCNVGVYPMDNKDIRIGLAHALDFEKANTIVYRGDSSRLNQFSEGYGDYTDPSVKARAYSVEKAEEAFARAGYTSRDKDGFLQNEKGNRLRIEITYGKSSSTDQLMGILKEGAKKAGLDLTLDGGEGNQFFGKVIAKQHMTCYIGWSASPPFPSYYQFFHSSNARDHQGNLKAQTNNINSYEGKRMDELVRVVRDARSKKSLKEASWEVQNIVHDEALFIPAFKNAYTRIGYWNWVKWPDSKHYQFNSPKVSWPTEFYLYWIDEEEKKRILESKKRGEALPEKNYMFDLYKEGIPSLEELEQRELGGVSGE